MLHVIVPNETKGFAYELQVFPIRKTITVCLLIYSEFENSCLIE